MHHQAPPLESVVREALRLALSDVKIGTPHGTVCADWFENWDRRLQSDGFLGAQGWVEIVEPLEVTKVSSNAEATEAPLVTAFHSVMERLGGEASVEAKGGGALGSNSFRQLPGVLLQPTEI